MPEIGYLRHESGNLFSGGKKSARFLVLDQQSHDGTNVKWKKVQSGHIRSGRYYLFRLLIQICFRFLHKIFRQEFNPDRELLPLFIFLFL